VLDDLKYIHQRDGADALGIAERQFSQLAHDFEDVKVVSDFANILWAGMGGSALAPELAKTWPGVNLPFEICRQYHIPAYVSDKTLFIAASYSGNTEETLSALAEAEAKNAQIVVMASGGQLQEIAKDKGYPFYLIPKAEQPRYGVFSMFKATVQLFEAAGLLSDKSRELAEAETFLKQAVQGWLPTAPTAQNSAKALAMELAGKSVAVYGGPLMAPAAYKWKISANENAKNVAWCNVLPEFDHNELIGWRSHPIQKPYAVVELRSNLEHPRVQKRFEVAERVLSGLRPAPHVVEVQGKNILEQLLWAVTYGDFVTLYLALLNNVDPAPVDLVEKFKKALDQ